MNEEVGLFMSVEENKEVVNALCRQIVVDTAPDELSSLDMLLTSASEGYIADDAGSSREFGFNGAGLDQISPWIVSTVTMLLTMLAAEFGKSLIKAIADGLVKKLGEAVKNNLQIKDKGKEVVFEGMIDGKKIKIQIDGNYLPHNSRQREKLIKALVKALTNYAYA